MSGRANLGGEAGNVYTIRPGLPFVDALADGLLHEFADDPLGLADAIVLLPTRRACRALREAFLRVAGPRALLLPTMRPLGEVDEDELVLGDAPGLDDIDLPPAIPGLRRDLLLAQLILKRAEAGGEDMPADQAVRLAAELARLIDRVQTERLSFDALGDLVPERYAGHWQETLKFLRIVTEHWPGVLAEEDCLDPADRRNRLLEAQAEAWRAAPPDRRIVAAGSTGSVPATADLLAVVAELPRGAVVLPGLDRRMDEASREAASAEETHPQFGMLRLLARLGVAPRDVAIWPSPGLDDGKAGSPPARAALVDQATRPAATTDAWQEVTEIPAEAIEGLQRVDCPGEAEEAGVIALALRRSLETEGRTAALVTTDRRLARRVAAELGRWHIEIDDSAGTLLADTPPGAFLRLVAEMVAGDFAPIALLAALKHPLATGGRAPGRFREAVRGLERLALRGPRPADGLHGLEAVLLGGGPEHEKERDAAASLVGDLRRRLEPLIGLMGARRRRFSDLIDGHLAAAEALAESDAESGAGRLWHGEAGEAAARFIAEAAEAAQVMPAIAPGRYPALFAALMARQVVRPRYGRHPRLHIWGPLEARLQHADLIVLGGLNERTWPRDPTPDPWLSRPMEARLGLPLPERRVGLAAHDFAQALSAPEVILTRAERVDGTPTVPSRWLMRLDAVLRRADAELGEITAMPWRAWQRALGRPGAYRRCDRPSPRPPYAVRPRQLSVTRIEAWMRDPYAIYARHVLNLRPLDPIAADPGAADRGSFIHQALDDFTRAHPAELPGDAVERLLGFGEAAFGAALGRPAVRAFWWPRFVRVAEWFVAHERVRRAGLAGTVSECKGELEIPGRDEPFLLTAKADRIDSLAGGGYAIVDYKTGTVPSETQIEYGYAPQLSLEAAIAAAGGFGDLTAGAVGELAYWRLSGGDPAGEIKVVKADPADLAAAALDGVTRLVAAFDDPATPYLAMPDPAHPLPYNDYEHLARIQEWSGFGGEGGE